MAKTVFSDGDKSQGIKGTKVTAATLNGLQNHRHDGLDADGSCPIDYAADTGAADAYVIALTPALTAHVTGLPLHFKATNANTGASTLAVNGLAAVAIKDIAGAALAAGAIVAGQMCTVIYTGTVYMLMAGRGMATDAEAQAQTSTSKLLSPALLASALQGSNQALSQNGYQKLPGGLIIQWGRTSQSINTVSTVTLPITFPNAIFTAVATPLTQTAIAGNDKDCQVELTSTSQIKLVLDDTVAGSTMLGVTWMAVGN